METRVAVSNSVTTVSIYELLPTSSACIGLAIYLGWWGDVKILFVAYGTKTELKLHPDGLLGFRAGKTFLSCAIFGLSPGSKSEKMAGILSFS